MGCLHGIRARTAAVALALGLGGAAAGVEGAGAARLSLSDGFADPPRENRPQVWWWFNASAPREAITRDLEGLSRVGVSGFHVYGGSATSAEWVEKVKWSLHEAKRLGLDGVVCIGSAGCGHPATDPRHAQKDLVFSRATVEGGRDVRVVLPRVGAKETPRRADGSPKFHWDVAALAVPASDGYAPLSAVRDVSHLLDRETGVLAWTNAPAGTWTILRAAFVPKVFGWMGCYIDHMSTSAFDAHWARVMTPLLAALSPDERAALKGVMCDSWEAGTVGWTETFADEFKARRGYDILPWLPARAGVKLESPALMNRFKRDYAETISELIAENHYAYQRKVANAHGLVSIAEAAGPHQRQGDVRRMQGRCDVAMGEFWMPSGHRPLDPQRFMVRDAASAAHVYGIPEVLAEAFTTINTYWTESPATMKPCADRAFCDGLTRVCYHGMMLSPSMTDRPGLIRNVGTHYNPQTTWFHQSRAFNLYLSRCSWMLSQGRHVADCLLYAGDAVGLFAGLKTPADGLGPGYDYDVCPTELLLKARVENGAVVLPSGARYRVLMLCDRNPATIEHMRPGKMSQVREFPRIPAICMGEDAMLKLKGLVEAGATLVGLRPAGPTSMNESSARFHAAADALWGARGSVQPAARPVGRGRVLRDRAEARKSVAPDFTYRGAAAAWVDWAHRSTPQGDVYFIANLTNAPVSCEVELRDLRGRAAPQVWNPVTGERTQAAGRDGTLSLSLPPRGSVFVVDANAAGTPAPEPAQTGGGTRLQVSGPWSVEFDKAWGGPAAPVAFRTLDDWTSREEDGIRHYSGAAVYRTTFDAPPGRAPAAPFTIDLGDVREVAEVRLNGVDLGVAWTAPFAVRCDLPLKATGNELEVRVTNLWPNRLIRDAGLPPAERLTKTNINPYKPTDPLLPSGLLGPVSLLGADAGCGGGAKR